MQIKLTCLVTLFDRKLQVFKNSPKWTLFGIFNSTFVHSKRKRSSLRSQCWMRLFLWFSNTVNLTNFLPKNFKILISLVWDFHPKLVGTSGNSRIYWHFHTLSYYSFHIRVLMKLCMHNVNFMKLSDNWFRKPTWDWKAESKAEYIFALGAHRAMMFAWRTYLC